MSPIDPITVGVLGGLDLGKLLISAWFEYQRTQGKTPEEMKLMFEKEEAEFDANMPSTLPDV